MRSGWVGRRKRIATSASRMARSSSRSSSKSVTLICGIELGEFLDARRQPDGTEADRRGDAQLARRLVLRIHQARLRRGQLGEDVMRGAVEHFALLGENEAARMAMEQRHIESVFKRADLAADRRLRQAQFMAGMGEASRIRHRVEDPELVPIHGMLLRGLAHLSRCMEISLGFERRHAAHARRGYRLAVDVIGHIARRIDAGNGGRRRAGIGR